MTFPHSCTIQRKVKSGSTYLYSDLYTGIPCFLQPLDEQMSQIVGMTFGKSSRCYVGYETDVLESDRLVVDGITYGVKGFSAHNYGSLKHKRVLLEQI